METSTEKQLPVSNRSCNLLPKSVKGVVKKLVKQKLLAI